MDVMRFKPFTVPRMDSMGSVTPFSTASGAAPDQCQLFFPISDN